MAKKTDAGAAFRDFKAALRQKQPHHLYIFHGEEDYLRTYYLAALKKLLLDGPAEDFNLHRFDAQTWDIGSFSDAIDAIPIMAEASFIQVDDVDIYQLPAEDREQLAQLLGDVPDYCYIVFLYDTVPWKPDRRQRKFHAAIEQNAQIVAFERQPERELMSWVARHFASLGKNVTPELCRYLITICGASMTAMAAEIDKIEITLSTPDEGGNYVTDRYAIAGTVPFFFTWDAPYELRLWNRFHTPVMGGFGSDFEHHPLEPDGWTGLENASPTLTIDFETPVSVSKYPTSKKYYAVLIPSRCAFGSGWVNPQITFDAYNSAGDKILTKTITTSSSQGLEEGIKYSFDLTLDTYYPEDVLSGLFSVAADKRVYIASGNLQAYLTPGGTATNWRIAPTQYEYVGASSYNLSTYEGWFDLFCFSSENNNFGISTSLVDDDHLGEARGWTDAYPVAQGRGWRTITDQEGLYLFGGRSNSGDLFSFATVVVGSGNTEVKGLIFLPDNWTLPENCTFKGMFESPIYDCSKNIYYAENAPAGEGLGNKWEDMQAAGAVFWPAAGMRQGTDVDLTVGAYWSGTPNDSRPAYGNMLYFCDAVEGVRDGSFIPSHYLRSTGACVRLIKEFN